PQSPRAPQRAHVRGLCRAPGHLRGARHRARRARDRAHRRGPRVLLGRGRGGYYRGALRAGPGGSPRIHDDDLRSHPKYPPRGPPGGRGAQRHGGRRRGGDRGRLRHPRRGGVGEDRLPLRARRAFGRRHGRLLAPPATRGAGPRDGALDDRRLHRREARLRDRALPARRRPGAGVPRSGRARREARARPLAGPRRHEAGPRPRGHTQSGGSASLRGRRAGRADGARQLPRSVRSLPRETGAEVPLMKIPDPRPIRAFLEDRHAAFAREIGTFASKELAPLLPPVDDAAARRDARAILARLGAGGWLEPIRRQDWRGCSLVREALAAASPLADAVFALQGLGTVPILLADNATRRERWVADAVAGGAMAAFAMAEREAGSDIAAIATVARRDGQSYILNGAKAFISNAGIADFYVTFASTDPAAGGKGISCFVVPADSPGLRYVGPQIMSAPHPLGEIAFEECRVPASNRLGEEGRGFALGLKTLDRLR